jgi:hypothetical protein
MPEALPRLQGVDDLIGVDQIHGPGVDDVHPLSRLAVLDERGRSRRQGHEFRRLGRGPPLFLVDGIERGLVGEELGELVGGVQDSVTR